MTEVVALRRSAVLVWSPTDCETVPVHSTQELAAQVSAWRVYGETAKIYAHSADRREASMTALGDDGWLVKVRHANMVKGGWPYSRTVTRLAADGTLPSLAWGSQWYMPDESTDLAGSVLFAEQIQFDPTDVARAAWAWLTNEPMPDGFTAGKTGYDHAVCTSVGDALEWIAHSEEQAWPQEAGRAAAELAEDLGVDRVVVTSPGQITIRVAATGRRVRLQRRGKGAEEYIRVIGMIDELGRQYTMSLPDRSIIRVRRGRTRG